MNDNGCPVKKTLRIIGSKWAVLIMWDLREGKRRFGEMRRSLAGISPKSLSEMLKSLEQESIVTKKIYPEVPPRVEYALTSRGKDLVKIIRDMKKWGTAALSTHKKEEKMQESGRVSKTLIALVVFTLIFVSKSSAGSDFKTIDTAQLHSMIVDNAYRIEGGREKQFTVVDARTKAEYSEAHIFSAISVPENDFDKSIHLLPKDKGVLLIVYCSDAKFETSRKWAGRAAAAGYANIEIYSEGFPVWKEKKMPVAPLRTGL